MNELIISFSVGCLLGFLLGKFRKRPKITQHITTYPSSYMKTPEQINKEVDDALKQ